MRHHNNTADGRRQFLRQSIALVPLSALTACGKTGQQAAAPAAKPRFFTEHEWKFVCAACDQLIPEDPAGPGALALDVPVFVDRQLEGEFGHAARWYMHGPFHEAAPEFGYQARLTPREVYRLGIADTDAYCQQHFGRSFPDLPSTRRDDVLRKLEANDIRLEHVSAATFFSFLLQNTREGYLADPMHGGNRDMGSWNMIGFPGARADFLDWVSRHGDAYPYGPVSVDGSQG